MLRQAGPWGQAFPEPVFEGHFKLASQRLLKEKHLKVVLQLADGFTVDGIYFNVDNSIWPNASITNVRAAFTLDINDFRNQQNVQLLIKELLPE